VELVCHFWRPLEMPSDGLKLFSRVDVHVEVVDGVEPLIRQRETFFVVVVVVAVAVAVAVAVVVVVAVVGAVAVAVAVAAVVVFVFVTVAVAVIWRNFSVVRLMDVNFPICKKNMF
jgi:hypothetical protein